MKVSFQRALSPLSASVAAVLMTVATSGCSNFTRIESSGNRASFSSGDSHYITDGSMAVSRPIPPVATISPSSPLGLGFIPLSIGAYTGSWIAINRSEKSIKIMNGDTVTQAFSGEGIENLSPGTYNLLHKQRNALWYAPAGYFQKRNQQVPPDGDRSRFRRGALGSFALFLNKETPIHSGPVWSDEIGGIRLNENDISRLYYAVELGAPIEVK